MKKPTFTSIILVAAVSFGAAAQEQTIADYTVATDSVLRTIPHEWLAAARNQFHVVYQHTSHGTHVGYGMFGLPQFKSGDDTLFAIASDGVHRDNVLDFRDSYGATPWGLTLAAYGAGVPDLSQNETAFINQTRLFLADTANSEINVVMWSWCSIGGHQVSKNYLAGMDSLVAEFSEGGSNPRASANPVRFILMTGHAEQNSNVGAARPCNQADTIVKHCKAKGYYCIDYYSIDSHDPEGNYWEDVSDDGASTGYGGNFYSDFQNSHTVGEDWYENKDAPDGSVTFGEHNTQHITANRKAFAMWWVLARMAGWDGAPSPDGIATSQQGARSGTMLSLSRIPVGARVQVYSVNGKLIDTFGAGNLLQALQMRLPQGHYVASICSGDVTKTVGFVLDR